MRTVMRWALLVLCTGACGTDPEALQGAEDVQEAQEDGSPLDVTEAPDGVPGREGCAPGDRKSPAPEVVDAYPQCTVDQLVLVECGAKINALDLGTSGDPGEGMDVDGDVTTCAPEGNCSGGIDNQLSTLALLVQGGIDEAIVQGTLILVIEYEGMPEAAGTTTLNMYAARIAPDDEECDWLQEACRYRIRPDAVDDACVPLVQFADATVSENGEVSSGGTATDNMVLTLPVFGVLLKLPVRYARLEGEIERNGKGEAIRIHGMIGGAIPSADLFSAIASVPADEFASVGLSRNFILGAVENLVVDDVDTDGDGQPDAASIAAHFDTLGAKLVGWEIPDSGE